MDLILRFDVLRTEVLWMVNIGQKYLKGEQLREKGLKLKTLTLMRIYISIWIHIFIFKKILQAVYEELR